MSRIELETSLQLIDYQDPISLTGPSVSVNGLFRWYFTEVASIGIGVNYTEYQYSWLARFRIGFDTGR
jgi:hypothetical protein